MDRLNFANKTRNVAVGTVKKSIETRSWIWLFKNAFQVGDGGVSRLGMSRETVRSEMLIPNLSSSPWIRGAPHRGLASAIFRISSLTSELTPGRRGGTHITTYPNMHAVVHAWTIRAYPSLCLVAKT